jgi:hypothetical protein
MSEVIKAVKEASYAHNPLGEDYLDSRDMLARIEYLESESELDDEDKDELKSYQELRAEIGEEYFNMGVTFIKDTYFSEAMRDDFLEFNQIDEALECYIDFDAWETACSMDYTDIEIGGYTYSYRL